MWNTGKCNGDPRHILSTEHLWWARHHAGSPQRLLGGVYHTYAIGGDIGTQRSEMTSPVCTVLKEKPGIGPISV